MTGDNASQAEPERPDPVRILDSLPQPEQGAFLDAYRQAVAAAADPERFADLVRLLRLWHGHVLMAAQPGYAEARAAALGPVSGGMSLDALR